MPDIFEVGGCVRDKLLGIESDDIDFTFVLDNLNDTTQQGFAIMHQHLLDEGFKIFLSTPEMFTIRAKFPTTHMHGGLVADFVMARKEVGYKPGTREPFLLLGTLEDDLIRRDFTLNAMAQSLDGSIIDLFGGQQHLREKLLVTPKDPIVTFMDDPLRMIRALRFAITKDFTIREDVWEAMFQDGLIDKLQTVVSVERISNEFKKMFAHDTLGTLRLLTKIDARCPQFLDASFARDLWLLPTFKKK